MIVDELVFTNRSIVLDGPRRECGITSQRELHVNESYFKWVKGYARFGSSQSQVDAVAQHLLSIEPEKAALSLPVTVLTVRSRTYSRISCQLITSSTRQLLQPTLICLLLN